jgi:hypothetical protein
VSRARCAACVGGGGWVHHGTTVRYSELADPHCLHVSFTPDISCSCSCNNCIGIPCNRTVSVHLVTVPPAAVAAFNYASVLSRCCDVRHHLHTFTKQPAASKICPCTADFCLLCSSVCFAQVPLSYWGSSSDEGTFLFHKGQLLTGCLDKAQFGKFGLVHAMQVSSWAATMKVPIESYTSWDCASPYMQACWFALLWWCK